MNVDDFVQVISGQRKGVTASCLRGLLWTLSLPWSCVTWARNRAFDQGAKKIRRIPVPVIAIGNLTTGGTGKTPVVAHLVQVLQSLGRSPGIVSRGYNADDSGENDEKRVLEQLCPGVPHVQHPDRILAAERLLDEHDVDVIVLDDAFQHRRIARDLNVVLVDATCPFGFGHQLPRGLLRESLDGFRRADAVLITRADRVSDERLGDIRSTIFRHNPELSKRCFEIAFQPTSLQAVDGTRVALQEIANQRTTVMTAIGNPSAFVATCERLGAVVEAREFYPDHHHYTAEELRRVEAVADAANTVHVLTTLKDLVKFPPEATRFLAVLIETAFVSSGDETAWKKVVADVVADTVDTDE